MGYEKRRDGVQVVQIEPSTRASRLRIDGFKFSPAQPADAPSAPESTAHDLQWSGEAIDFQGIEGVWVANYHDEDYMELLAVFPSGGAKADWDFWIDEPDGSAPWPFGVSETALADVTLSQFGYSVYLRRRAEGSRQDGHLDPIVSEGTFTVPPCVVLRFVYYCHEPAGNPGPEVRGLVRIWDNLGL